MKATKFLLIALTSTQQRMAHQLEKTGFGAGTSVSVAESLVNGTLKTWLVLSERELFFLN